MKKRLLNSIVVLTLVFGSSIVAMADNVVYGLLSSYSSGASTTSLDLDKVNDNEVTTVTKEFSYENLTEVKCGATAGDKYFAMVSSMDPVTYNEVISLVTINFTTGNLVTINDVSYTYGKPGYNASGMTYDEQAGVLYTIETSFDNNDNYITLLYSVDQNNGVMIKVATWPGQYQAVASDHNGAFYLVKNQSGENRQILPQLYKATIDGEVTEVVNNPSVSIGYASGNSIAVDAEGKHAYYVAATNVVDYDLEAKTTTLKGKLSNSVLGVSYGKSTADGTPSGDIPVEKKNTRLHVATFTYGSTMGDIADDIDSRREYFYYNPEGKLVGSINLGREYAGSGVSDTFSPSNYTKVSFDENGNITNKAVYQWGPYDFDEFVWKKTDNGESFTYDENGALLTDTTSYSYYTYTYNEDGTVASKNTYNKRSKTLQQSILYSNYDENGNAHHYSSTGAYKSYEYEAECEYDEDGNKLVELQYTVADDPEFPGFTMNVNKQLEIWNYEDGILRQYTQSVFDNDGNEVPTAKTDYTPVNGNVNEIAVADSTYSNGKWYSGGLLRHFFYTDFAGMDEMTSMESIVELVPDEYNTVMLEFTLPQLAYTQLCNVVIYRDCQAIDTVNIFELYSDSLGFCVYKDKELKNGTYTYFIQPLFSSYSEGPLDLDDDMGVAVDEQTWTGYYATMPQEITVYTQLPAATNLELVGGRVQKADKTSTENVQYADLKWTNPVDADKYGFVKNSICFVNSNHTQTDITDIDSTKATVMLEGDDVEAYVMTSYKLGKAFSDTIPVTIKNIETIAAIDEVTVAGAKITFNGRNITLSQKANISVFAANGQQVYAEAATDHVALTNLPNGNYIICVEDNGKVNAYKYNLK